MYIYIYTHTQERPFSLIRGFYGERTFTGTKLVSNNKTEQITQWSPIQAVNWPIAVQFRLSKRNRLFLCNLTGRPWNLLSYVLSKIVFGLFTVPAATCICYLLVGSHH